MRDIAERKARLVRPEVRNMSAYRVADASGLVKLDAMENPYSLPESLRDEWLECLRDADLNRYPPGRDEALERRLRESLDLPDGVAMLLGNGSDELIQLVVLTLVPAGGVVLAPEPSFSMYAQTTRALGFRFEGVAMDPRDFSLSPRRLADAIDRVRPDVVFLAHPNNPTGNLLSAETIEAAVERAPGVVVIDEAYAPFAMSTFVDQLRGWPHVFVLRTLSKLGLAGLRLGIIAGHPEWIAELDKLRLPYNINLLTQRSAGFALAHAEVFDAQTGLVREERARLYESLASVPGVQAWPSHANFVLFRVGPGTADSIHRDLAAGGVLVKNLNGASPLLADCLRVTVGTPAENERFLGALSGALAAAE